MKWNTLQHNGVLFPDKYRPHHIKLLYNGKPIKLSPESEEVATFYAAIINTDYVKNPIFNENYFNDFKRVLQKNDPTIESTIKTLKNCDFSKIYNYLEEKKLEKKNLSKDEKTKIKEDKEKQDEKYMYVMVDGKKEKIGNFRIEPPGLFRGRGSHPKTGSLKTRVLPEQITINIGDSAKIPTPPKGHSWGEVVHEHNATWLAKWSENINGDIKYVWLGAGSTFKNESDLKKFEKSRELKNTVDSIRESYKADMTSMYTNIRQRATALYLIDNLALRAGNEKGEDKADTVGTCTLKVKHVILESPNFLIFDFLGKDSIRYYNRVPVNIQVYKNMKLFKIDPKTEEDLLFDKLNTTILNNYLNSLLEGLTAKVFRTFNASYTFQKELKRNTKKNMSISEKMAAYNLSNKEVAVLCNHQKAVSKTHDAQITKMKDKIKELKDTLKELKKEDQSEKTDKKIEKIKLRIKESEIKIKVKDDNKCVSLGTSKTNYLDPRISVAWSYKYDVPLDKVFPKTLQNKFQWALEVDPKWEY
jgi:DNA topoisomerase-1